MIPFFIATIAPALECIQLCPQLRKIYISKSVKDLSFASLLLIFITNCVWLLHGYFIMDNSIIIACVISMIINIQLLILYFLYTKNKYFSKIK